MKLLFVTFLCVASGCASGNQSAAGQAPACVETPTAEAPAKSTTCDDEETVGKKVEALRARHIKGELNADELYAEQGAVIDGACFKAYLPIVEDDLSPMGIGPATRLRKLKSLYDAGIVDKAEYEAKKRQILEVL